MCRKILISLSAVILWSFVLFSLAEKDKYTFDAYLFSTDNDIYKGNFKLSLSINGIEIIHWDETNKTFLQQIGGLEELMPFLNSLVKLNSGGTMQLHERIFKVMSEETHNAPAPNELPDVYIYFEKPIKFGEKNNLSCFAVRFFPLSIQITILKNNVLLPSEIKSSGALFDDNWKFQLLKSAEVIPMDGDVFSCSVEHVILKQTRNVTMEPKEPYTPYVDHSGTIVGAAGTVLGITGLLLGIFLIRKHCTDRDVM
ncbi:H-2 class II histocompatibility antigen, A-U alpha chain-like [Protopterus annectens]|uniref:H-2 class II histocompatibility antigen, A-U alpha chain-like n=1 Tax=Protopterus annectens TaxID=7888 RepID=UPI001CFAA05E|nr:H-2 class II histocompatibility antigen, A-U alpha chain-like [Protopterus annectens]